MISIEDKIEISGKIIATGTGTFTVALNEIFVDEEWRKFSPAKEIEIADSDYDKSLTPQELELVRMLADKHKDSTAITHCQQVLAKSIVAKLTKDV